MLWKRFPVQASDAIGPIGSAANDGSLKREHDRKNTIRLAEERTKSDGDDSSSTTVTADLGGDHDGEGAEEVARKIKRAKGSWIEGPVIVPYEHWDSSPVGNLVGFHFSVQAFHWFVLYFLPIFVGFLTSSQAGRRLLLLTVLFFHCSSLSRLFMSVSFT